ncbi:MAG TPA: prephenate dehydrogenase/arogenate dehydrogenase family protein [Bacteroidales bacterium]|nr:prephenate dehydrogenase/arogenate dehydrogenase family protein [Bacteroidales bacterium]
MKILVLGAGNMGAWFVETLCLDHEVGVYDPDKNKLKYFFQTHRFVSYDAIQAFKPELVINAVSLQHTFSAFDTIIPYLPSNCIISDITSVKNGLPQYYQEKGMRYVSTHPMFGPTFAKFKDLSSQSAIIIKEGDEEGKEFFRQFYKSLQLSIYDYTFEEHDQTIAYSLSIPFSSTLVFASCMKKQEAPGTTFKKHYAIAQGLLSENDYLLSEILLSPYTLPQVQNIKNKMELLIEMIQNKDTEALHQFFGELRKNIG